VDPARRIGQDQQAAWAAMDPQHCQQRPDLVGQLLRRRRGQVPAPPRDHHHGRQGQDLLARGVRLGMDLHFIEFDQHDIRVHRTGVIPLDLGVIGRTTGEADRHRGGRRLRVVGSVMVISGLRPLLGPGGRGYEEPKGLGVACRDRLGAGMAAR
jgi:hypothetical protein